MSLSVYLYDVCFIRPVCLHAVLVCYPCARGRGLVFVCWPVLMCVACERRVILMAAGYPPCVNVHECIFAILNYGALGLRFAMHSSLLCTPRSFSPPPLPPPPPANAYTPPSPPPLPPLHFTSFPSPCLLAPSLPSPRLPSPLLPSPSSSYLKNSLTGVPEEPPPSPTISAPPLHFVGVERPPAHPTRGDRSVWE